MLTERVRDAYGTDGAEFLRSKGSVADRSAEFRIDLCVRTQYSGSGCVRKGDGETRTPRSPNFDLLYAQYDRSLLGLLGLLGLLALISRCFFDPPNINSSPSPASSFHYRNTIGCAPGCINGTLLSSRHTNGNKLGAHLIDTSASCRMYRNVLLSLQ